jgi:hypothetical protein
VEDAAGGGSSWFLVLGSWFLVLGSWFLVLGSWFLVLGSWLVAVPSMSGRSSAALAAQPQRAYQLKLQLPRSGYHSSEIRHQPAQG